MDRHRFDALARALSAAVSRRETVALLLAGVLGSGARSSASEPASARKRQRKTKRNRQQQRRKKRHVAVEGPCGNGSAKANRCKRHGQCCTGFCHKKKGRCRSKKLGQPCTADRNCWPKQTGRTCQDGACQPAPASTCAETCPGCCDGETCQPGDTTDACGMGGAACATCSGATPVCWDGACVCGDVCASGCQYSSVQEAINNADVGATITVCAGAYTLTETITIGKDLTLIGAGQGSEPEANTILDGNDATQVLRVSAGTVVLESLRITGGQSDAFGGGIINSATLTLTGCTVSDNAAGSGGGIDNEGTLELTACTVTGNSAITGGGIANNATLELTDCTVSGNTAGDGGGIFNKGVTLTLNGGAVSGNTADNFGGGIFNYEMVTLEAGATVTGNNATFDGGGIYNDGILGGGTSTCSGGSSVSGNTVGPQPGTPSDCVAVSGGNCDDC